MQDVKLELICSKKDGRRAQISSVGRKLLYEIHPWCEKELKKGKSEEN